MVSETETLGAETLAAGLAGFSDARLTDRFRELEHQRRQIEAELATVIGEAERRVIYAVDGHASIKGWCRTMGRWSMSETAARHRLARLMHASPEVTTAITSGHLGLAQADLLARAFTNPRCGTQLLDLIDLLLRHAQHLPYEEFRHVIRRWETLADADGAHRDHRHTHLNRTATISEINGIIHLTTHGDTADGAELTEIFRRYRDAEFDTDWQHTLATHGDHATPSLMPRTNSQRSWDALTRIFRDAASTPANAQPPEPVVNLIIGLDHFEHALAQTLAGSAIPDPIQWSPNDPRWWRSETTTGIPVPPANIVTAALIGHVRRVVINSAGVVVNMGRKRRLFTGPARDAVLMMLPTCTWPGCPPGTGRTQADHTHPHQHGGTTSTTNGGPACPHHNRHKNLGFTVHRDPNGYWHTHRPNGTEIT
jgi:Domain of unknown function (DUF222)